MKKFLLACLLLCLQLGTAYAADYYVANNGNDNNDGTSAAPWQTISKVNIRLFQPGDTIHFRCGSEWREQLNISSPGTAGNPITFKNYGNCNDSNKPIINASQEITGWSQYSENIYAADVQITNNPDNTHAVTQLFADGQYLRLAQHPNYQNTNYMIIDQNSTTNVNYETNISTGYIIDNDLGGSLPSACQNDLIGASVHIRVYNWAIDDGTITDFNNTDTLYFQAGKYMPNLVQGYGYYLDNKLCFLDNAGEWYYDKPNSKLYVWLPDGSNPDNHTVEASIYDFGISIQGKSHVVIEGLQIKYAAVNGIDIRDSSNFELKNLHVSDSGGKGSYGQYSFDNGGDGIYIKNSTIGLIDNSKVLNSVNEGIRLQLSSSINITNNEIENSGTLGSAKNSDGAISMYYCNPTFYNGQIPCNINIANNTIVNSGYNGIALVGKDVTVQNNVVENSCLVLNDCGGIYTWTNRNSLVANNFEILGNIVINSIGNLDGTPNTILLSEGIYLDEYSNSVTVRDNTIVNASQYGIFVHNAFNNTVDRNTLYSNKKYQLSFIKGREVPSGSMYGNIVTNNILFSKEYFLTYWNAYTFIRDDHETYNFFQETVDGNCSTGFNCNTYSFLYSDKIVFETNREWTDTKQFDLPAWQSIRQNDLNAIWFKPFVIPSSNTGDYSYILMNKSPEPRGIYCSDTDIQSDRCGQYIDLNEDPVIWPVQLPPYSSKIIIWNNNQNGCTDKDGDGYAVEGGNCGPVDCNDLNTAINPGAVEICDGIDNNCNGQIDEGIASTPTTCGVGACASTGQLICQNGSTIDTCTPGTPQTERPFGDPTCSDSVDNDCDGLTDAADFNCAGSTCTDKDGDGYAIGGGNCGPVDCNDKNPKIHPGAAEVCRDRIDQNCNGMTDDKCPRVLRKNLWKRNRL